MIRKNSLEIEYRAIADLRPYQASARVHTPAQRRKMRAILQRFGPLAPVLIDESNVIIDGHLVIEELKGLGFDQAPVVVVRNRDPAEIAAIRLALNRLPADSKWDNAALRLEFQSLLDLGFDLDLTGFDQVEIDITFSIEEPGVGLVEEAPLGLPEAGPPITKLGDLWLLGEHRLICGDARDAGAMALLMGGEAAQMAFTDPPYNVQIRGFVTGGDHREFPMASGEMSREQFRSFLGSSLTTMAAALADGAIAYVCMDWRHLADLQLASEAAGLSTMNCCVWAKTNAGQGAFYRSQTEMIWVLKHGSAPHLNNFELGQKGRSRSNLWRYPGMNIVGGARDKLLALHPTVKPLSLVIDAVKDVSRRGDIVLDPFLGSGTTLIAAHETGRLGYSLELDPLYADLIVRRWQDHTGGVAVNAGSGLAFNECSVSIVDTAFGRPAGGLALPSPGETRADGATDV